jgi:2',3'-cyclic-nucleotide 2'-phosphodiesterase (5'-nucleotidase family)
VSLTILHTNDMHGTLDLERLTALKKLRSGCDLYFDTGDAIKTGNLGVPLWPEPVWTMLDELHCDAGVLGNRETHPVSSIFKAKLAGTQHPILCANLRDKAGVNPLARNLVIERKGLRIGLVGVMVPMVTDKMKTQFASAYLWRPPVEVALEEAEALRPNVDALFALTHIGHRQDVRLAESGAYDVIFGGHSHTVLMTPERVSHNRFAGVYQWDGELQGGLAPLPASLRAGKQMRQVNL